MEMEQPLMHEPSSIMSAQRQTMNILCCMCGISFNPQQTKTNICITCLTTSQDITVGITKQGILNVCRMCRRYNRPPWVYLERESRDLLALCLKKIKGLNSVKLLDARFLWTEPHSRRIKLKLTIQKEVINNASLQHTFEVEFFEHYMQCDDCKKEFTPHTWGATVQLRQRVAHKRTFYYLEQLILKCNAHQQLIKIEEKDDGIDFYYKSKQHALRLVDFLQTVLPVKVKPSKQLVSYDEQNDIYQTKYSWSAEIPRICKDDLVIIPPKLCKELGGVCPLLLCIKLSTTIRLLDPKTMKRIELTPDRYYHYESDLQILTLSSNKSEFIINDCEKVSDSNLNESYLSSMSNLYIDKIHKVNISRTRDWEQFDLKTHLGSAVKVGGVFEGYDITNINFEEIDKLKNIPEVILVKRIFDKSKGNRIWKLKRIEQDGVIVEEGQENNDKKKANKKQSKNTQDSDKDFEDFMNDVEVNPEMQKNIRMFKNQSNINKLTPKQLEKKALQKKNKLQRKKVVVTNIRKVKDSNIFNTPQIDEVQDEEQEEQKTDEFKQPTNKKQQQQGKKTQQPKEKTHDSDEESEYDDEVKLFQLEEWFENIRIEENQDDDNNEENDEAIDQFIQQMDNVKLDK